ncbi:MAG: PIN domain-containing protein [Pseudomonadota bacterium]|uniref:PIN domain-containing protein n=1 Tax=Sphingomonas sp. ERG5 TaxID=1381597 RepID=UPI00054B4E55|nr:PIN domain-containing protein [Sphingomonas sp. ERG5]
MYLLDTDLAFELHKIRSGDTDPGFAAWIAGIAQANLFLSVLTPIEIESAAATLGRRDKTGATALRDWVERQLLGAFDGRVLPLDAAVASRRSQLGYADMRDGLFAATALVHGLTLATRRTTAFKAGRVRLFNPWGYTPDEGDDHDWRQAARGGPVWLKSLFVRG